MQLKEATELQFRQIRKIMVIADTGLMNVLSGLQIITGLRSRFKKAQFVFFGGIDAELIFNKIRLFDRCIFYNTRSDIFSPRSGKLKFFRTCTFLKKEAPDMVVVLPRELRYSAMVYYAGIDDSVGLASSWLHRRFLGGYAETDTSLSLSENYDNVLKVLPWQLEGYPVRYPVINFSLWGPGTCFAVAPLWCEEKDRWLRGAWVELINRLQQRYRLKAVLVGRTAESLYIDEMARETGAVNLAGSMTQEEMYSCIASAAFYVGNKSETTFIAANLGIPVFTLIGPDNPLLYKPGGGRSHVICPDADVPPSHRHKLKNRSSCSLKNLTVSDVIREIDESGLLGGMYTFK